MVTATTTRARALKGGTRKARRNPIIENLARPRRLHGVRAGVRAGPALRRHRVAGASILSRIGRLPPAVALAAAAALTARLGRRRYLRWGAGAAVTGMGLPGDELVGRARLTATRAITVRATAAEVWPWIAQLGQARGGFYSYDVLENLVGCDIHSADRIVPAWQSVDVGDQVRLHPDIALTAALVDPGRAMVLRGGIPMGKIPVPYDFTWAFVVSTGPAGTTRVVVRERYAYTRWWAPLIVEPAALVSAVMSPRMLRGIRRRAEGIAESRRDRQGSISRSVETR